MGGTPTTAKYIVRAHVEIDGVVEKPDVIGAIFGQTEGLLGEELDLRELQKSGRIGRIQVDLESRGGKSTGEIIIPSSLDRVETALIAAAIETVDKVGPCAARITIKSIEDVRQEKRKRIIERAKDLLRRWESESSLELKEMIEEVAKAVRAIEIQKYGPEGLPAGPDVDSSDIIIVVEGRADVINMLRYGYRNVIALEGATVPETVRELCKRKTVIAFVDGDRGGELILKELLQVAKVDYIARAPPGKEVEELSGKEIAKCLKNKISVEQWKAGERMPAAEQLEKVEELKSVKDSIEELKGTLEALLFDENWKVLKRVAVRDLVETLQKEEGVHAVVFDGVITQRLVETASSRNIKMLIGARVGNVTNRPADVMLMTFEDVMAS